MSIFNRLTFSAGCRFMSITVSLIVPVYNGGKFAAGLCRHFAGLHKAVEGIELIVVNDGSTDDTSAQFRQFFNEHPELQAQLIDTPNGGVSRARNIGLSKVRGEYVMFMDHDDNIDPPLLTGLVEKIKRSDADMLQFNVDARYPANEDEVIGLADYMDRYPFWSCVWSYIYKRSLLEKAGLKFIEGMKYLEDGVFLTDYLLQCQTVIASNTVVYDYVDNPESAMRSKRTPEQTKKYLDDIGLAVREYTRLLATPGQPPKVVRRLLEIRDSFQFIHLVSMLKSGVSTDELFRRLEENGYDFRMAGYPSKFNRRRDVRLLCHVFRSRLLLKLLAASKIMAKD